MSDSEPDKNITATVSGIKDDAMTVEMKGKKMRVVKNADGCWNVNGEGEVPDAVKAEGEVPDAVKAEAAVKAAEEAGDEEKGVLIDTAQFAIDALPEGPKKTGLLERLNMLKSATGKGGARRKRRSNKRKPKKSAKKPKRSKKGKTRKQKK